MTNKSVSEFVLGWHADAVVAAKNIGLTTSIVHMPGGYPDRLYVRGEYSALEAFKSMKHLIPGGCMFSPGVEMHAWR